MDLDELYLLLTAGAVAPYLAAATVNWMQTTFAPPASLPGQSR